MAYPANMTVGQIRELVENPGQPIRQPAVSLFTVDTADRMRFDATGVRTDTTPVNSVYINKQQNLMNGYITRIALTEINIPWNIPNVNDRNNFFCFTLYSTFNVVKCARLTNGFYTPDELATALETAMNAEVATVPGANAEYDFTVTYNEDNANFTISNDLVPNSYWSIEPTQGGQEDDLTTMMGFGAIPATVSDEYLSITGGYASMLYTPYFDIVSKQLTKKQNINDNSTSIVTGTSLLARIYITSDGIVTRPTGPDQDKILGCRPFTIHKEFQNPKQIYWDTKEFISIVDLQLVDYKGQILYESPITATGDDNEFVTLGTGGDNWQLTLQITET